MIRDKFLIFVELQRTAEEYVRQYGRLDRKTIEAFENANALKREILTQLDAIEGI